LVFTQSRSSQENLAGTSLETNMSFSVNGNGQELLTFKIIHHGRLGTKLLVEGLGANPVEAHLIYKQMIFSLRFGWIFGCPSRD
jgi:hypothetical protein